MSPDRGDDRHLENIGVHSLEATHEGGNEKQNNIKDVEEEKLFFARIFLPLNRAMH